MRVFKTLTLFIVILISKCVKIYAVRKTLKIYGAPQCLPQFTRPPVADNTEVKVTAIVGSSDGSQVYSQLTKTLPCDELITIEPYFRDKEIDKKSKEV
uniref:Uncharacterized protein n=1 Tax=Strongyloides papillosus TaxID=174720 RepID=A0A0N5BRM4_STREA